VFGARAQPRDYRGLYHVLHGAISPMDGRPGRLKSASCWRASNRAGVREVILGDQTLAWKAKNTACTSPKTGDAERQGTRLARGLPVGGDLEYADEMTLARALEGRREM